jgi:hypothetical protein
VIVSATYRSADDVMISDSSLLEPVLLVCLLYCEFSFLGMNTNELPFRHTVLP